MEKVKLGDCTNIISGFAFDSKLFNDKDGMPLIRIRDVKRGFTETYTTEKCDEKYLVENNDILIGMDGEFNIEKWGAGQALLNQRVCKVIPKNNIDKDYIYFLLPKKLKDIENKTSYATVKHISIKQIENIEFNYVILEEQKKIASKLRNIKQIIDIRKKQIEDLEQLIKSQFVEMFGSVEDTKYRKEILGNLANIKHGHAFKGEFFSEYDNGIVLTTPGNFKIGGGFQEDKCKFFNGVYDNSWVLTSGDLIVTMTDLSKKMDTLGYGAIVPQSKRIYLHNQRIGLFQNIDKKLNKIYIEHFMRTEYYHNRIISSATGSTVHHTSPSKILSIDIPVPPIELQNQFAEFVKLIDKQKFELQKSLEELQKLQESLMNKYFGE